MTDRQRVEAAFDRVQLEKLLALAQDAVLVGGQAVAFWASFFNVPVPPALGAYVTKDSDFLGNREDVARIASGTQGVALYPHQRGITALAGQVRIDLSGEKYLNIDVLHRIVGFDDGDSIRKRAQEAVLGRARFKAMHPLDCLRSRLENLHKIPEKRGEAGAAQAELAARVVGRYLETVLEAGTERLALKAIESVAKMAFGPAGRFAYGSFGVDLLEAVPVRRISNRKFLDVRWPQIRAQAAGRQRPKR
jgi:hypothetical protein